MNTEQATVLVASLLRSQRVFQTFDLSKEAKKRVVAIQRLVEEYEASISSPDASQARDKLVAAYPLLGAKPPSDAPAQVEQAILQAVNKADHAAEAVAWRSFLAEVSGN